MQIAEITIVIPTIGRPTLRYSIESALVWGYQIIVVADGIDVEPDPRTQHARLGRRWGAANGGNFTSLVAITAGAYLAKTPWIQVLDDDDEIIPNYREDLLARIAAEPDVDIWIPGLVYTNGWRLCMKPGLRNGNVCHANCYRTEMFGTHPMAQFSDGDLPIDFTYVKKCYEAGKKIGWVGSPGIFIRPRLRGLSGNGAF